MQPKPSASDNRATIDLGHSDLELRREDAYGRDGHTARTLVREADLRIVHIAMRKGASISEHHTDHTASIHVLSGHVRVRFSGSVADVPAGHLFVFEAGAPHEVDADVDSSFLLTLGWRNKE
jgi:quercetin dioxygenase-like cupin family protein